MTFKCLLLCAQGPFSRSDILAWFDEQYFNDKLRIRPANPKDGPFRELSVMLKAWGHIQKKDDNAEQVHPCSRVSFFLNCTFPCPNVKIVQHMISRCEYFD